MTMRILFLFACAIDSFSVSTDFPCMVLFPGLQFRWCLSCWYRWRHLHHLSETIGLCLIQFLVNLDVPHVCMLIPLGFSYWWHPSVLYLFWFDLQDFCLRIWASSIYCGWRYESCKVRGDNGRARGHPGWKKIS